MLLAVATVLFAALEGPFLPVAGDLAVLAFSAAHVWLGRALHRRWFAASRVRGGLGPDHHTRGDCAMSEPNQGTEAAGEGLSDEEMVETVAEQTDSASEHADVAGKDWDGDPSSAPAPDESELTAALRRPSAVVLRPARTAVRWGVRHALPAVFLDRGARRGELIGPAAPRPGGPRPPYAVHEQLRAQGPLVRRQPGPGHDVAPVAQEVLRSEAFGVGWDRSAAPRLGALGATSSATSSTRPAWPSRRRCCRRPAGSHALPAAGQPVSPRGRQLRPSDDPADADAAARPAGRRGVAVDLVAAYAAPLPLRVIADPGGAGRAAGGLPPLGRGAAASLDLGRRAGGTPRRAERCGHARVPAGHFDAAARATPARTCSASSSRPADEALADPRAARQRHAAARRRLRDDGEPARQRRRLLDAHPDQLDVLPADPSAGPGRSRRCCG